GWDEADAMATDPAFASAVSILGAHYSCAGGDGGNADSCSTTQNALNTGKPLWDSEQGSQDDNSGAPALIRAITRGYIDAQMTALLNWPLIASMTSNLPYPTDGMMVADSPWSGNYSVGKETWVTAQVTQFTQPGWQFLNSGSGYLGGNRNNGSYVSLASPAKTDYSTIAETTTASAAQTATFTVPQALAGKTVHVWATNLGSTSSADSFVHLGDVTPGSSGTFDYTLQPDYVYTFSTVGSAGHGAATGLAAHSLALPYSDNYNEYAPGQEARYTEDMQGTFEAQPCAAGRSGMCLQQMLPIKPIEWQQDSDAFTLIGDPSWTNYSAKVDVEMTKPGTVELMGRAGTQNRPQSDQQGYYFQVSNTGSWTLLKSDDNGNRTTLATASVPALGINTWHQLGLSFSGSTITASVDGKAVVVVNDGSYTAGQVGLGITSYDTDQFDNLSVTPTKSAPATPTMDVSPSVKTVQMGTDVNVTATFSVPKGSSEAEGVNLTLNTPSGFYIDPNGQGQNQLDGLALAQAPPMPQVYGVVKPGQQVTATWQLTAPVNAASTAALTATATFAQDQVAHVLTGNGSVQVVDPPAPTGTVDVSSLPFLSSTNGLPNGWGPVERDESVGGSNANDGEPITIDGTVYPKGLGTNSVSDVKVYLGGHCSTFTSTVGVDAEVGDSGSVTFSVLGDGQTLASTKVINGGDPTQTVTANVTGVQILDLVVGDGAPPGNGNDHGDWAMPTLTCSS
ncbi:MAG TPA: NPCBM/NEW2 domain-containing protein, partial [Pseudonocardiaceae bacterium]